MVVVFLTISRDVQLQTLFCDYMNVTNPAAAHEMLEKLPLGQAHIMSFELITFGSLNALRKLPGMSVQPQ